ncbi:class I SAM-dependent methyltransferase [Roseateles sp.]|uniref:class I SAM-dependent methyltransferase n=1 Tax=Roseateles sp. TaxID=1971397 RepID=UPI003BAB50AE
MPVSFRDPAGTLQDDGDRIWRTVHSKHVAKTLTFLASRLYTELTRDGLLIPVIARQPAADGSLRLEHPRVAIPSYPFEWSVAQLAAAGELTLEIQRRAWADGYTLKDASAFNVLFIGSKPVLCDLLSLEVRNSAPGMGWHAYGQFVRHYLLPLIAAREQGRTPRDIFLAHRDGLRALDLLAHMPWHRYWGLDSLLHFRIPGWLETRRTGRTPAAPRIESARAVRDSTPWLLNSLGRSMRRLGRATTAKTSWGNYVDNRDHYEAAALERKRTILRDLLQTLKPAKVLDLGANTGEFSRLAIEAGAEVVAIDEDVGALDRLQRQATAEALPLQAIHANFARPTPPTGWRLGETLSLRDRLNGRFDAVLMLAVAHHLAVTERLPLAQVFEEISTLCTGHVLVEFVSRQDPRFVELAGPNLGLFEDWSSEQFVEAARPYFELRSTHEISAHRRLLLLRRTP